jgi:uncharacterized protein (TIGR03067 family)
MQEYPMKSAAWIGLGVVLVALTTRGGAEQGKGEKFDAAKLVGNWSYVSGEKNGQKLDAERLKGQTVIVTKETITLKSDDATFVIKYTPDPKNTPVSLKMEITDGPFGGGAKADGIIEIRGDDLKICYAPEGGDAPKAFEAKEGSKHHLFVLKRAK